MVTSRNFSPLQLNEFYKQMVGEVGIQPDQFYQMSPDEIDLAYEGYLYKKETDVNLLLQVLFNHRNNNYEIINLLPENGFIPGSLEEREKWFNDLGIMEVNYDT